MRSRSPTGSRRPPAPTRARRRSPRRGASSPTARISPPPTPGGPSRPTAAGERGLPMKVVVVSEFYPRRHDPVLGVWAHRQALAAQAAGAEVRVIVLHRVVPPLASVRSGPRATIAAARARTGQPRHDTLDGLPITYVPFISPMRSRSYPAWGAWAALPLRRALRRLRRRFDYDLVHAHNAI